MTLMPAGVGTGVGSMPGTDPAEAAAIVNGELDFAYLAELPARGIGADLIGRMAALLVDLPMDASTWGYRLGSRGSAVTRRARGFLAADLDAIEESWDTAGFIGTGRTVKVQVAGPFTLAASVELANGHKAIRDRGAVRDLVDSSAEGLVELLGEVRRRLGASVIVQLDEPMVGAVIDGTVQPLTRLDVIAPIPVADVAEALSSVRDRIGVPMIVHNCGAPRWDLIDALPAVAYGLDVTRALVSDATPDSALLDGIGALIDRGDILVAGVISGDPAARDARAETIATALARITDRIGLPRRVLATNVIVSPSCGLAGESPRRARTALEVCARSGELLANDPDAL